MRTFIKTVTERVTLSTISLSVTVLLSIVSVSSVVLAYGPQRATFTQANPATYVTFNSITDDPTYGDERNFYRVRDISTGEKYGDEQNLVPGRKYEAQIFFHNNAASTLNDSGVGIAKNVMSRADMPAIVKAGAKDVESTAYVNASNANPTQVYDDIAFNNTTNADIALRLVPGSVKYASYGPLNGQSLSDTALFSTAGQPLGYDSLNGTLPGCDRYSGYITFQFTAEQPNFTFQKDVRLSGTKDWQDKMTVNPGATVEYRMAYDNTGQTQQNDVTLKDQLPNGVTYLPGSSKLYTGSVNGKTLTDEISQGGMNIGSYKSGANAFLVFSARIDAAPCTVLTNTGYAVTNNGNLSDTATVTVGGQCTTALPTTGPAEIAAGLIGVGAITLGVVYYFKSRRDLDDALLHTQTHPSFNSTNNLTSDPDASVVADVDSEKTKHKKPEHKK